MSKLERPTKRENEVCLGMSCGIAFGNYVQWFLNDPLQFSVAYAEMLLLIFKAVILGFSFSPHHVVRSKNFGFIV